MQFWPAVVTILCLHNGNKLGQKQIQRLCGGRNPSCQIGCVGVACILAYVAGPLFSKTHIMYPHVCCITKKYLQILTRDGNGSNEHFHRHSRSVAAITSLCDLSATSESRRSSALKLFHDAFRADCGPAKQLRGLLGKFKPCNTCSLLSGYMIAIYRKSSLPPQYLETANSSHHLTYHLRRECTASSIIPSSTPRIDTCNTAIRLSRIRRETSQ